MTRTKAGRKQRADRATAKVLALSYGYLSRLVLSRPDRYTLAVSSVHADVRAAVLDLLSDRCDRTTQDGAYLVFYF